MKILNIIIIILIFSMPHAKANLKYIDNEQFTDSNAVKAKKLKQLYLLSTASSEEESNSYKQQFFDEFPHTFKELNEIYGYNSNSSTPLYLEAQKHINMFFNDLNNINDTLYYRKIISIAIDGHWDGDAINYFQYGLRNKITSNPDLTIYILKDMNDAKILSFWFFYFDGVHAKKEIPQSLQRIKSMDYKAYKLMIEAQIEVLKHSKE